MLVDRIYENKKKRANFSGHKTLLSNEPHFLIVIIH